MNSCAVEAKPIGLAKMSANNVTLTLEVVRKLDAIHCNIFGGELIKEDEPILCSMLDYVDVTGSKLRLANEIADAIIFKMKGGD